MDETRGNLMDLHSKLIKVGRYNEANRVLQLLKTGVAILGPSEADTHVRFLLEDMGIPMWRRRSGLAGIRIA